MNDIDLNYRIETGRIVVDVDDGDTNVGQRSPPVDVAI